MNIIRSETSNYKVYPVNIVPGRLIPDTSPIVLSKFDLSRSNRQAIRAGAFLSFMCSGLLAIAFSLLRGQSPFSINDPIGVVAFWGLFLTSIYPSIAHVRSRKLRKLRDEEQRRRDWRNSEEYHDYIHKKLVAEAEKQAQECTYRVRSILQSSGKFSQSLATKGEQISLVIARADVDYKENAYAPFWDAVHQVANDLANLVDDVESLSKLANDYHSTLKGKNHDFPPFPDMPNTLSLANDFRRIVRMGQTNFEFANIWEHRRTREALIKGFKTLGDAVNNVGTVVEQAAHRLETATSTAADLMAAKALRLGRNNDR